MTFRVKLFVLYPAIWSLINPPEHWFIVALLIEVSLHMLAATFLFNNVTFQFSAASAPRLGPIIILVPLASPFLFFFSDSLKCKRILKWIAFINSEPHHDEFYSVAAPFVLEPLTISTFVANKSSCLRDISGWYHGSSQWFQSKFLSPWIIFFNMLLGTGRQTLRVLILPNYYFLNINHT